MVAIPEERIRPLQTGAGSSAGHVSNTRGRRRAPTMSEAAAGDRASEPGSGPARATRCARPAIRKQYGGVHALEGADLEVRRAEVHALLGENGAGKSTLVKIVAGVVRPDEGEILVNGEPLAHGLAAGLERRGHRGRVPGALADPRAVGDAQSRARRPAAARRDHLLPQGPADRRGGARQARPRAHRPALAGQPPAARPAADGRDHEGVDAAAEDPDPGRGDVLARRGRGRPALRARARRCATRARR